MHTAPSTVDPAPSNSSQALPPVADAQTLHHRNITPSPLLKSSGQFRFLIGVALICLPRAIMALVILCYQRHLNWFFPAVEALVFITVGYTAWRGERWGYYFLMFLNVIGCIAIVFAIPSAPSLASLLLAIASLASGVSGGTFLSISEDTHSFMSAQRRRFASNAFEDE